MKKAKAIVIRTVFTVAGASIASYFNSYEEVLEMAHRFVSRFDAPVSWENEEIEIDPETV